MKGQRELPHVVAAALAGHVCLQNHGHDVRFRNVAIRPLGTGSNE